MHRSKSNIVALVAALAVATPAFAQTASDHLACYRVKDTARKGKATLTLSNAAVTLSCSVQLRAQLGCLETQTSNVVPTPPGAGPSTGSAGDFLCYKLTCPKPFPAAVQMTDQLSGSRVVRFKAGQFLCAPATRGGAATVVTTTSTTLGACSFNNDDRRCEGSCGNGGHCSAVTSGGSCECRTTSCGDASSPECRGFCDSGESCTFTILAGCHCINIP